MSPRRQGVHSSLQAGLECAEADKSSEARARRPVAAVDERPGRSQQVDALGDEELADEETRGRRRPPRRRMRRGRRAGRRGPNESPAPVLLGTRGSSARLRRRAERVRLLAGPEAMHVHAGRAQPRTGAQARIGDRLEEASAVWAEPARIPPAASVPSRAYGTKRVGVRPHRVGDVRAVDLDRETQTRPARGSPAP